MSLPQHSNLGQHHRGISTLVILLHNFLQLNVFQVLLRQLHYVMHQVAKKEFFGLIELRVSHKKAPSSPRMISYSNLHSYQYTYVRTIVLSKINVI